MRDIRTARWPVGIGVLIIVAIGAAPWLSQGLRADEKDPEDKQTRMDHGAQVSALALSKDGRLLVVGGSDGVIGLWKPKKGELVASLRHGKDAVTAIGMSPDGRWLVSGSREHSVVVWDLPKRQPANQLKAHRRMITAARFGPRGRHLVTADYGGSLKLWSTATWRTEWEQDLEAPISDVAWVGEKRFVSAGYDGLLRVWSTENREPRRILKGHKGKVECVAASKDGRLLVSGGHDQSLRIWDVQTGDCVRTIDNEACPVDVAVSNSGALVLTTWDDSRKVRSVKSIRWHARIWSLRTGKLERTIAGHDTGVTRVAWGPEDRWFVTGSADKTTRVWQARR